LEWTRTHNVETERFEEVRAQIQKKWVTQIRSHGEEKFINSNIILHWMRCFKLLGNKHIPEMYFGASREERLRLAAALIDGDGSHHGHEFEITQKSELLSHHIQDLMKSLGYFTYAGPKLAVATNAPAHEGTWVTRMQVSGLLLSEIPTLLSRKQIPEVAVHRRLPKILFGEPPVEKKKRKITWTDEMDNKLEETFKKFKKDKKKWVRIRDDPSFAKLTEKHGLTRRQIQQRYRTLHST
jgi:hypothetical protein